MVEKCMSEDMTGCCQHAEDPAYHRIQWLFLFEMISGGANRGFAMGLAQDDLTGRSPRQSNSAGERNSVNRISWLCFHGPASQPTRNLRSNEKNGDSGDPTTHIG